MANLDKYQDKAVKAMNKNTLIVAPPGSGKTTVILNRVKYLISEKGIKASNIIVITFTRAAAENMKNRFIKLSPNLVPPFFGTFHGLFYKILLRHDKNINIINSSDAYNIIRKELVKFVEDVSEERIKEILNNISLKKTSIDREFKPTVSNDLFDGCLEAYETFKNSKGLLDFDDLQIRLREVLKSDNKILSYYQKLFQHILVDEFQDCDELQIDFLKTINSNIFCVGDEDQCIYSFRGSTPQCMVDFQNEFIGGEKIYLKYNYRSVKNIVDLSKEIISNNKERNNKEINGYRETYGQIILDNVFNESQQVDAIINKVISSRNQGQNYSDTAILYRTNLESRSLIDGFIRAKIPFKLLDKEYNFFNHFICQDMIAYLKLSIDPYDKYSFKRIINKPFRYVSKSSIEKVMQNNEKRDVFDYLLDIDDIHPFQMKKLEEIQKDISYLNKQSLMSAIEYILTDLGYSHYIREYCDKFKQNQQEILEIVDEFKNAAMEFKTIITFLTHIKSVEENLKEISKKSSTIDSVIFSTIHGVKGMEFKNVHIIDIVEEFIPHVNGGENIEEERRLFYVGVTRAINNLYLYCPKNLKGKFRTPSSFIPKDIFNTNTGEVGFKEGDIVEHNYFGKGIVDKIEDGNISILFGDNILRKFSIRTLMENNLLKGFNK